MKTAKTLVAVILSLAILAAAGYFGYTYLGDKLRIAAGQKIDDWKLEKRENVDDSILTRSSNSLIEALDIGSEPIGLAVGGAKDANNFRENIENNYMPLPTDITYEGVFYDYAFDTGLDAPCTNLFCPSYSTAVSADPFSGEQEYFLTLGLNSGISQEDFSRKPLNLVVVLDISGSMNSKFDKYYYDDPDQNSSDERSKMIIANESVAAILEHLNPEDRFGMVVFDDEAYTAKPLSKVENTDMKAIREHILEVQAGGGTNMEAGLKEAESMYREYLTDIDADAYEHRIIFLTDAMPNTGVTEDETLATIADGMASKGVYTSFIGVGVDFNTELIEQLNDVRGSNYYAVHSAEDFAQRLDEEFEFMVTPLVFDLNLQVQAQGYDIEAVYGSPQADISTGEVLHVETLFPSKREDNEAQGGVVLMKLKKTGNNPQLSMNVQYEDIDGDTHTTQSAVTFESSIQDSFDNSGIRKAIVLSRYVNAIKQWSIDTHMQQEEDSVTPYITDINGIPEPIDIEKPTLSAWERQSLPLTVSQEYALTFAQLADYISLEADFIEDESLLTEVELLQGLAQETN